MMWIQLHLCILVVSSFFGQSLSQGSCYSPRFGQQCRPDYTANARISRAGTQAQSSCNPGDALTMIANLNSYVRSCDLCQDVGWIRVYRELLASADGVQARVEQCRQQWLNLNTNCNCNRRVNQNTRTAESVTLAVTEAQTTPEVQAKSTTPAVTEQQAAPAAQPAPATPAVTEQQAAPAAQPAPATPAATEQQAAPEVQAESATPAATEQQAAPAAPASQAETGASVSPAVQKTDQDVQETSGEPAAADV